MTKKAYIFLLMIFILSISIGAIYSADVNGTDLSVEESVGTAPLEIESNIQSDDINDAVLGDNIKNQTQISPQKTSIYHNGAYEVALKDLNANSMLANRNVNVAINDVRYSNVTSSMGIASFNLNLTPGIYTAVAAFDGDDGHFACNLTYQIKILPTIKAKDLSKYYKGSQKYTATFLDSNGNPLKNTQVNLTINGKVYLKKTNNKGEISQTMNLKPGNYKVISTNPVTGYRLTTNFKVLSTLKASNLKKVKGDGNKFVVKFFKNDGKALANQKVKIKINSKTYKYRTNPNGKVKLSFNGFKKGKYTVVSYNKDGLSQTNTVKVYNIATTKLTLSTPNTFTVLPNGNKNVKIKLSTSLGGESNAGKSVKIKIGEKTYYRNTDAKGAINFNLPVSEGIFTIEYEYAGDKFFKPAKVTNHVTVLKTNDTKLKVKGLKSFGYGAGSLFKVLFKAGNVPLAKKSVTIALNDRSYNLITDINGFVSVPVNLNIGNYTVNYKAPGDSQVKGTSGSCDINVFKRSPSKITWKSGTVYKDSSQSFKVFLANSKGNVISDGKMELSIGGEIRNKKTASDGYATMKTSVPVGKYKVTVNFKGSNDYLPSSISKNIRVDLSKFGSGLNVKDGGSYSSAYLHSTSHCQVNSQKIKSLVNSLTSGLTDSVDKVKAMYNYVRDNIVYDYYYNTRHGAVGTLDMKSGNCADQAHLLVAMYRTAGFKARYVHGTCFFGEHWYGHVWTQVLVGDTWIVGDPINYRNDLGKIKNWNPNTYSLSSRYIELPF